MTRSRTLVLAIVLPLAACDLANSTQPPAAPAAIPAASITGAIAAGDSVPGEWIVVFRRVTDAPGLARQIAASHAGQLLYVYQAAIQGFAARLPDAAVQALHSDPSIAYIEPNRRGGILGTQTNPPWGLDRIDQRDLPLNQTYNYGNDGTGITAYVLDTGVRLTHNEFGGRAAYVANGANGDFVNDGHGSAADCHGHGTHVAGTLGGATYGVAKNVQIRAARVVDCIGSGTVAMAIAGVDWVTNSGVRPAVVNMSLGYGNVQSLRDAVENSIAAGFNYAVAAGNGNLFGIPQDACKQSPAGAPNALTAGATRSNDAEASFSNYGTCVDILAPGVNVLSAWYTSNTATNTISGTSMATPHVAGVAARYLQANPTHSPAQVSNALRSNASLNKITLHSQSQSGGTANRLLYSAFIVSGPVAPVANYTSSCAGRLCSFTDVSTDADGSIVSRSWSFGDGATSSAISPEHTYAGAGSYNVMLMVTDNTGLSSSITIPVSTNGSTNLPPVANFKSLCPTNTCTFTNNSGDSDGTVTAYQWEFGDGATSTVAAPSHTYAAAGTYLVTLRVSDNAGALNWQSMAVVVNTTNANPFASFTFPATGLTVDFQDFSTDADGSIVSRLWEFGDGATSPGQNPSHTFPASASYDVTLTVTDDDGAQHVRTRQVTVIGATGSAPAASFQFSCAGLTCSFDDTSTDADGRIVSRSWDFGGGATSNNPSAAHTFATAGTHNVVLTVTDDDGLSGQVTAPVTAGSAATNAPPIANFKYVPAGNLTYAFTFLGADTDGTIASRLWEFGDGTTSTATTNPSHTYATAGTYEVTLRVTDNAGASHWQTLEIVVTSGDSNTPPFASFTFPKSGLTVNFTDFSTDSNGSVVAWYWEFGDGATSTVQSPPHTYLTAGRYLATLQATDDQGRRHWRTRLIIVP